MRIIVYIFLGLVLSVVGAHCQQENDGDSKGKTSISLNADINDNETSYSYFSISDSDEIYHVKSRFDAKKTTRIREYLIEELGEKNMEKVGDFHRWIVRYNGDKGYEIKLDEGSLRIYIDKELTSSNLLNKFRTITKNIKTYTSGKPDRKRRKEASQHEKERLERESKRKLHEAERLQRAAERLQKEAERLRLEVKKIRG